MSKMRIFTFFCLFFSLCFNGIAQNCDTTCHQPSSKIKTVILPGLAYSPETKVAFALTPMFFANFGNAKTTRPSLVKFPMIYTLNKQILTESYWEIFTPKNRFVITGMLGFRKYPNRHYGIGNEVDELIICREEEMMKADTLNYLNYSNQIFQFQNQFLVQVRPKLYIGLQWNFERHTDFEEIVPDDTYHTLHELNFDEHPIIGQQFGVGLAMRWDSRNHLLTPSNGDFLQINYYAYHKILNSDFQYFSLNLDYRKFIKVHDNITLATHYLHQIREANSEEVIPFFGLAQAGGQDFQRGYFLGTFRDKNLSSFQVETRINIWHRIGGAIFGGGAQTYGTANSFNFGEYNFACGAGLRCVLNKTTGLTMRMDCAVGLNPNAGYEKPQKGLYVRLREAF